MALLPVLISIPHGGTQKPPELEGSLCITDRALFDDSDPFVVEIYDLGKKVQSVIKADIARSFVDLNRSKSDLLQQNPDGLIKSQTCYREPIYIKGKEPDESMRNILIKRYYDSYHEIIQKNINANLNLCLDCHSMASKAPEISPDETNKNRPAFCLSNQDGKTSSSEMITLLADCISKSFSVNVDEISLNDPFHGGHITKTYGNNPIPWIQIEMNRSMYLSKEWFNHDTLTIDKKRLRDLNQMFHDAISQFCSS